jgi:hypothetical protein
MSSASSCGAAAWAGPGGTAEKLELAQVLQRRAWTWTADSGAIAD